MLFVKGLQFYTWCCFSKDNNFTLDAVLGRITIYILGFGVVLKKDYNFAVDTIWGRITILRLTLFWEISIISLLMPIWKGLQWNFNVVLRMITFLLLTLFWEGLQFHTWRGFLKEAILLLILFWEDLTCTLDAGLGRITIYSVLVFIFIFIFRVQSISMNNLIRY